MKDIFDKISKFASSGRKNGSTFMDQRLVQTNCDSFVALYLLLAFLGVSVVISVSSYVGPAIQCAAQQSFPKKWYEYASTVCLLKGTYYWPDNLPLDTSATESSYEKRPVDYYALIPLVLVLSSAILAMPNIFWQHNIITRSGFGLLKVVKTLRNNESLIFSKTIRNHCRSISKHINQQGYIQYRCKKYCSHKAKFTLAHNSRFLLRGYMVFKFQLILAPILVIFLLNYIFNGQFIGLGYDFIKRIFTRPYKHSILFPLFTLCDAKFQFTKSVANIKTFECFMVRNIFNEVCFTVFWFLLHISIIVSTANMIISFTKFYNKKWRIDQVERYLSKFLLKVQDGEDRIKGCPECGNGAQNPCINCKKNFQMKTYTTKELEKFIEKRLTPDVLLCLSFIENRTVNSYELLKEILLRIWLTRNATYKDIEPIKKDENLVLFADPLQSDSSEEQKDSDEFVD